MPGSQPRDLPLSARWRSTRARLGLVSQAYGPQNAVESAVPGRTLRQAVSSPFVAKTLNGWGAFQRRWLVARALANLMASDTVTTSFFRQTPRHKHSGAQNGPSVRWSSPPGIL